MHRRGLLVVATALLLLAAAAVTWWTLGRGTDYERAVGWLPEDTLRVTWTDWAAVRAAARAPDPAAAAGAVEEFLGRAYDLDLTAGSALADATAAMRAPYGFSPLDVAWEVLGQARTGQVVLLGLEESVDVAALEARLRRLGYDEPPAGPGEGGTWQGGADLVAAIDRSLTPVLHNVAVLPDERVVVMSDAPAPVSAAVAVVRGEQAGLDAPLAAVAGTPVTAWLWAGDFACEDLAMSAADVEDQRVADALVEQAGGVSPLAGLVMASQPDGSVVVGMRFESDEQASRNLQPRVDLAAGEAPGQGGTFAERFRVASGEAEGEQVVIRLEPRDDFVLSDITAGPVLFATC